MVKRINLILNDNAFKEFLKRKEKTKKKMRIPFMSWEEFFIIALKLR